MKNQIAQTILKQLGGNKFIAMTGVKNLGATENSLQMKLSRNSSKASHLIVTLNSMDTYDMEFIKISPKTFERKVVLKRSGIYNDMLQSCFTETTGLYTSL